MPILLIPFIACLVMLAWLWQRRSASPRAKTDPVVLSRNPVAGMSLAKKMTEHAFLRRLVEPQVSDESRQLQDSLVQAEKDERCIRRAMFLMTVLFLLSLAGLGYCALLLPDIFGNPDHFVMRGLGYLALGALISQGLFFGYLLWHRMAVRRLHRECRQMALALTASQPATPAPTAPRST